MPPRLAQPSDDHRQPAIGGPARRREDARRDLFLDHQRHRGDALDRAQPGDQQRRGYVVGQVGDDRDPRAEASGRDRARVALDHPEPAGMGGGELGERRRAAPVALDRDDARGRRFEERAGEAAGAGADFHHRRAGERLRAADDPAGQVEVEQEMLAESLPGAEPVPGDHLAERREAVSQPRPPAAPRRRARRPSAQPCARRRSGCPAARRPRRLCRGRCRGRARCGRSAGPASR